jgi:phage terminase small subunit
VRQRGRKSAEARSVITLDGQSTRPSPPATLSEPEREMFATIIAGCDADHFRQTDLPLLSRYCEAAVLAERAALELRNGAVVDGKPSPWIVIQEKCVRAIVSLSMRLRLSPQSRIDPKTLGRQQPYSGRKPWDPPE